MPSKVRFMLSYTLAGDFFLQVDALHAHVDELDAQLQPIDSLASAMNSPVTLLAIGDHDFLERAARDGVLDAVLDVVAHQRFGALPSSPPLVAW